MRRLLPVLLPVLLPILIGACEGGAGAPPPMTTAEVHAGFPRGGLVDTIVVNAIERLPLRAAELIAPDGSATPAGSINVIPSPRVATGQWAAGDLWQNAVSGSGGVAALTSQNAQAGGALQSQTQLLATVSTAEIALPDPVAYRRDWANYHVRLTFGTLPAEVETREIAAPEPPPG